MNDELKTTKEELIEKATELRRKATELTEICNTYPLSEEEKNTIISQSKCYVAEVEKFLKEIEMNTLN